MDFPHDGVDRISHVGIVVGLIDDKRCLTIEGNTSGTGDQTQRWHGHAEGSKHWQRNCWVWNSKICPIRGRNSNNRNAKIGRQADKGENKKMDKAKALAASWARSFMAAALALYMAGVTDPKTLAMAGVAAVAPVILRWLNPQDKSFGLTGK
jgi:hypothetical protein